MGFARASPESDWQTPHDAENEGCFTNGLRASPAAPCKTQRDIRCVHSDNVVFEGTISARDAPTTSRAYDRRVFTQIEIAIAPAMPPPIACLAVQFDAIVDRPAAWWPGALAAISSDAIRWSFSGAPAGRRRPSRGHPRTQATRRSEDRRSPGLSVKRRRNGIPPDKVPHGIRSIASELAGAMGPEHLGDGQRSPAALPISANRSRRFTPQVECARDRAAATTQPKESMLSATGSGSATTVTCA